MNMNPDNAFEPQRTQSTQRKPRVTSAPESEITRVDLEYSGQSNFPDSLNDGGPLRPLSRLWRDLR